MLLAIEMKPDALIQGVWAIFAANRGYTLLFLLVVVIGLLIPSKISRRK